LLFVLDLTGETMRSLARYVAATWLSLITAFAQAAVESANTVPKAPTLNPLMVVLLVLVVVGVFVFIGVAAVRAERKSKETADK